MHDKSLLAWYSKNNLKLPEHISHDVDPADLASKMQPAKPKNWRQEGNQLIADTDFGPLINYLPTNKIMTGLDKQGLPVFKTV